MGFLDKAKDLISGHPEQAEQALQKAEDAINQQTGGKYADQIATGGDKLGEALGLPGDQPQAEQAAPAAPAEQPQAEAPAEGEQNPPA